MIKLGDTYKDKITGFEGIAVARTEYFHGPVFEVGLEPPLLKDGKPMGVYWFKEDRVEKVEGGKKIGFINEPNYNSVDADFLSKDHTS